MGRVLHDVMDHAVDLDHHLDRVGRMHPGGIIHRDFIPFTLARFHMKKNGFVDVFDFAEEVDEPGQIAIEHEAEEIGRAHV